MNTSTTTLDNTVVGRESGRVFLVVVDDSDELAGVLRYACNRARHTGGKIALLYVIDMESSKDFQHWQFVGNLMEEEAQETAENTLSRHAAQISKESGSSPDQYVRNGNVQDELFHLVKEHPDISILLLGSAPGEKPGPLVEAVTGKHAGQIGIPVTIVPGSLSNDEIDRLT
ncbi:MAG: universal stress protein [Rhodospirillaceae bacterium]|jgi:nucleotide-binding universal stress UspA family protein|nr:universal stress protein [Rhodospirillaceae bacterium]MBT5567299.1 universal stress protein [Rhodospirillaceae bacterium]MBT6091192.1 universal stress protein [Rhodospirillaceae bacterium]MBT7451341.1 universal stress protein [Rhodospirillaceae bacterium]